MTRWLVACGAGLGLSFAQAQEPRRYAVVIGANQGGSNDGELRYAERDAERVSSVLRQLGGVYEEDLITLRGPSSERVSRVLGEVSERAATSGPGSVLVVYYSGHADANALHLGNDTLSFDALVDAVESVPVDVRVLVVDACKSGSLTRPKGGSPAEPFELRVPPPARARGTAIMTSSSDTEDSQESDSLRGGVFTHHWVTGLLGAADASRDRKVTLQEAYRYGYNETIRTTSQARFVQHPTYSLTLAGEDDLVLTRLDGGRRTGDVRVSEAAHYLFFEDDARGDLIAEARLSPQATLALDSGSYWVRSRSNDGIREGALDVQTGAIARVDRSDLQPVSAGQALRKGYDPSHALRVGVLAGVGVAGSPRAGLGTHPTAHVGLRLDGPQLTGLLRVHYGLAQATNDDLSLREDQLGIDIAAVRLFDIGPVSPGLGVRAGTDWVSQRFTTDGHAPNRNGWVARAGSVLRAELALSTRQTVGVHSALDVVFERGKDVADGPRLQTGVAPSIGLEWTLYAR